MTSSAMPTTITDNKNNTFMPNVTDSGSPVPFSKASAPPSPRRRHLLRVPGEEESDSANTYLLQPGQYRVGVTHVPSLARISTCNSSLTQMGTMRQESYR